MRSGTKAVVGTGVLCLGVAAAAVMTGGSRLAAQTGAPAASAARQSTTLAAPGAAAPAATDPQSATVAKYCASCHNDRRPAAGLSLVGFDVTKSAEHAEVAEKMIVKLRAGMMPPAGATRPDQTVHDALVTALESTIDTAAAASPNPGRRTFQRLNRPEYERAIKELLDLDVNAGDWLPLDTKSANFDNIADAQALSPTLLEGYLNAATAVSRLAVGDRNAPTIDATYTNPSYMS
ncbi:MAG: DUF1587 domain-containing protein, partial [Acidobacteriota bacterium]|nr:DUF1587 domain-containing protein [Acidobacteriota bacterium]